MQGTAGVDLDTPAAVNHSNTSGVLGAGSCLGLCMQTWIPHVAPWTVRRPACSMTTGTTRITGTMLPLVESSCRLAPKIAAKETTFIS